MIGLMMRTTLVVGAVAYAAGVMESSWRHYFHRYTNEQDRLTTCLLYTSPSPRDVEESRMPSSA